MAKTKKPPKPQSIPKLPETAAAQPPAPWVRETVESIVIAFVLAFLFRTFEAEAFVIPTGSMAPTLMGQHKDVYCTQCGHRFQVNASIDDGQSPEALACAAGTCPICRYTMPMTANLPGDVWENYPALDVRNHRSYNGDRILVNKYIYTIDDPQRWDVVVFHFPGDAQMNYIKRLVGLPGETLRIFQGDLYVKSGDAAEERDFQIEHKPASKVLAMRQLVHDTAYDPASLYSAGWPLRWGGSDSSQGAWKFAAKLNGQTVAQRFDTDGGDELAWIRYHHYLPDYDLWRELLLAGKVAGSEGKLAAKFPAERARPQLVVDFNAYNTRVMRQAVRPPQWLEAERLKLGLHWVGDLMVEADVDVTEARGELALDLVEGGKHFSCTIDLKSGEARLSADGAAGFAPKATTIVSAPGQYRIGFANVDDQLLLFVKKASLLFDEFGAGDLVEFDGSTTYNGEQVFGNGGRVLPETSELDPGDLAPVGIGAKGAKLTVTRLRTWRDIYYIADSSRVHQGGAPISDYDLNLVVQQFLASLSRDAIDALREIEMSLQRNQQPSQEALEKLPGGAAGALLRERSVRAAAFAVLPSTPSMWTGVFSQRREQEFPLGKDQFFVMGDNSEESSDAQYGAEGSRGVPGGEYLERRLLIGKALCVYWPHSWNRIPRHANPVPVVSEFWGYEISEVST